MTSTRIFHLFNIAMVTFTSAVLYSACSSSDDPAPVDCNASDLAITLVSKSDPTTCSSANGSITVAATGGKEPYQFAINGANNFQSGETISGLNSGSFTITVKDANGCTKDLGNIAIAAPGGPSATIVSGLSDTSCSSDNGSFTINATGGTAPYSYSVNNGTSFQASNSFAGLKAGNYQVVVKDAQNCSVTISNVSVANGTGVSYTGQMLLLFQNKCSGSSCHPANGDWFTYSVARAKAGEIKTRTGNRSMPATGSLTQAEIDLIACWVDHGAPQN